MKKSVIALSIVLILGLSAFVSAFSFSSLFGATGNAVSNANNWKITNSVGTCWGKAANNNTNDSILLFMQGPTMTEYGQILSPGYSLYGTLSPNCLYDSKSSCDANGCQWLSNDSEMLGFRDVNVTISVDAGWNLVWGLIFPSQIQNGTVSPYNIKAMYLYNNKTHSYISTFPKTNYTILNQMGAGNALFWAYFNKSGSFNFRMPPDWYSAETSSDTYLSPGWNFVGVMPWFFKDAAGNPVNSFNLSGIRGDCNITEADFYEGGNNGQWVPVSMNSAVDKSKLLSVMAVKTAGSLIYGSDRGCTLGKPFNPWTKCVKSANGNATLSYTNGTVIKTESPTCATGSMVGGVTPASQGQFLLNPGCNINSSGTWDVGQGTTLCDYYCNDGACVPPAACSPGETSCGNLCCNSSSQSCGMDYTNGYPPTASCT